MFFSSAREKFSPKISVFAEKISLTGSFCLEFARISTFAGEEKEEEVIFHPLKQTNRDENGHFSLKKGERERKYKGECDETRTEQKKKNRPTKKDEGKMPKIPERKIKMGKVVLKQDSRDRKTKGHHRKDQAQPSKTNCFSSPPPLRSKNTSQLSLQTSPLFATSSLVSLKTSLPRTKSISPYAQDTRLRVYTRSRTQRICHFCLHLTPQQAVDQSVKCEGKPCIHLHLHRNNLKFNTLHDFHCKKQVKAKG